MYHTSRTTIQKRKYKNRTNTGRSNNKHNNKYKKRTHNRAKYEKGRNNI